MARRPRSIEQVLEESRERLRQIRTENPRWRRGLRRWVQMLEEKTGYRIGYSSARRYEMGEFPLTAEYLLAVCLATDTNPAWVLSGEGPRRWSDMQRPDTAAVLEELLHQVRREGAPV